MNWIKRLFGHQAAADAAAEAASYRPLAQAQAAGPEVWAVGGGKGGVGKSFVASHIGILLAKRGKTVLMLDADLGAANLHTFLGVEESGPAISSFLKGEVEDLKTVVTRTSFEGLDLVSGARDSLDVADTASTRLRQLRDAIKRLDYDYVIVDTGPGTSANVLDLFLMSSMGVLLFTPEPTTIENNYRFLKSLFLRRIKTLADSQENGKLSVMLQRIFSQKWAQRVRTVSDIVEEVMRLDPGEGIYLKRAIEGVKISVVLNQLRSGDDPCLGDSIKNACAEYFGIEIAYAGHIPYGDAVVESIRRRRPLAADAAGTEPVCGVDACLNNMLSKGTHAERAFNIF